MAGPQFLQDRMLELIPSIEKQEEMNGFEHPEFFAFMEEFLGDNSTNSSDDTYIDDIMSKYASFENSSFKKFTDYMDIFLVPAVAFVGLTGNIVSFIVFVCTYMRRQSSSIYLAALSVADMMFLICVLFSWAEHAGVYLYDRDGWCQTFIYITYISSFLSVWFVVSFTCERYIVIMFPLRRTRLCTTKRAKFVVGVLTLAAVILYSFGPWTSGIVEMPAPVQGVECVPLPQYIIVVDVFYNIDTIVTLIVPFFAIIVMNLRIMFKVVQFYRIKKSMPLKQEKDTEQKQQLVIKYSGVRQMNITSRTRTTYTRTQVRVTKMLLTVSTIFLVLNLPRHTTRTYSFIMRLLDEEYRMSPTAMLWDRLFQFLYYTNFSVNLFLYSVLNISFRKAFLWLIAKIRHSIREFFIRYQFICTVDDDNFTREFKKKRKQSRAHRPKLNTFV